MKSLRYGIGFTAILGVSALMLLVMVQGPRTRAAEGDTGKPAPKVLLLTDIGAHENILVKMIAFNWEVTTITTLDLELLP